MKEEITEEVPEGTCVCFLYCTCIHQNYKIETVNEEIPDQEVQIVPDATSHTQNDATVIELQSEANQQSVDLSIARVQEINSNTQLQTGSGAGSRPNTENQTNEQLATSTTQLPQTDSASQV